MSWEVTMDPNQLQTPQQPLLPSSPSRRPASPPQHAHWDPGGLISFSDTPPSARRVTVFSSCPPTDPVDMANSNTPATDPAEQSKGTMGQGTEDRSIVLTPDKDLSVPTGVQGLIKKDLSGQDVTETTQATNDQGHPLAPFVNVVLDKAQVPIGAHGPAKVDDNVPPPSDPQDGSDEVVFSSPALSRGSEEAVIPHNFFTTDGGYFVLGMKPCVHSGMISESDEFVMPPLSSQLKASH